jgi:hypothetical protein
VSSSAGKSRRAREVGYKRLDLGNVISIFGNYTPNMLELESADNKHRYRPERDLRRHFNVCL